MGRARATFAAGCFWGVEDAFRAVPGVVATGVGYCGGHTVEPSYADVCGGGTGHAETVQVEFDPDVVSYDDLLAVFWGCHDPTQRNRQGPDIGSQYRSAIFCHDSEQQRSARASLLAESRSGRHHGRIVTRIEPLKTFWPAEEEHQQYMEKQLAGSLGLNRP